MLSLIAVGGVARGIDWLIVEQKTSGLWDETRFTTSDFSSVFYLRYHGYYKFLTLWALARTMVTSSVPALRT
ncbi:MAG: hypothetical protein E5299_01732 [Burkholderia gladioli]|nr:MAG: hypothetical protein E5299_01732 [Burkholderia gladioli]